MSIELFTPVVIVEANPTEVVVETPTTFAVSVEPADTSTVTAKSNHYSIVGDSLYVGSLGDTAPQWLTSIIESVVDFRIGSSLRDLDELKRTINNSVSNIELAHNSYEEAVEFYEDAEGIYGVHVEQLNATFGTAVAEVTALTGVFATKTEAVAFAAKAVEASFGEGGLSKAAVNTLSLAIAKEGEARTLSSETLEAQLAGQGRAISDVTKTAEVLGGLFRTSWEYNSEIQLDNGLTYNSGFGIKTIVDSSASGDGIYDSEFWINAEKLRFVNNSGQGAEVAPFSIDASVSPPIITFNGAVTINYRGNTITDSFTLDDIPQFIGNSAEDPVAEDPVTELPIVFSKGDSYFNTTNGVIYTWDGSVWVPPAVIITGYLTNANHTTSTNFDGTGATFTGAGGTFKVFEGSKDVTTSASFTVVTATKDGVTAEIDAAGVYSFTGTDWTADSTTFTFRATYKTIELTQVYSISKAKTGTPGEFYYLEVSSPVLVKESPDAATPGTYSPSITVAGKKSYNGEVSTTGYIAAKVYEGLSFATIGGLNTYNYIAPSSSSGVTSVMFYLVSETFVTAQGNLSQPIDDLLEVTGAILDSQRVSVVYKGNTGDPGDPGVSSAIVYIYRRSATILTDADAPADGSLFTYNFTNKTLTVPSGSWSATIPAGTDQLYVCTASALASLGTETDTILGSEFSAPQVLGANGINGINTATITMYQRVARNAAVPSKPTTTTVTYTFSTGALSLTTVDGWTRLVPNNVVGAEDLYVITAVAASSSTTDTIVPSDWSTPVKLVTNGVDGAVGSSSAVCYIYRRSSTALNDTHKPTGTFVYTFNTKTLTAPATGANSWSTSIPSGSDQLYVCAATALASGVADSDSILGSEFSTPQVLGANGLAGMNTAIVSVYKRTAAGAVAPTDKPTGSWTYTFSSKSIVGIDVATFNGWSTSIPDSVVGAEKLYVRTAAAFGSGTDVIDETDWSSAVLLVENGVNGANGSPGSTGSRGSGMYRVAVSTNLTNGVPTTDNTEFAGYVASSDIPGGNPVQGDILTAYNASNPALATTKKFNGVSWESAALTVHGDAIVDGTLSAVKLQTPVITGTYVEGAGTTLQLAGDIASTNYYARPNGVDVAIDEEGNAVASGEGWLIKQDGSAVFNNPIITKNTSFQKVTVVFDTPIVCNSQLGVDDYEFREVAFDYTTGVFDDLFSLGAVNIPAYSAIAAVSNADVEYIYLEGGTFTATGWSGPDNPPYSVPYTVPSSARGFYTEIDCEAVLSFRPIIGGVFTNSWNIDNTYGAVTVVDYNNEVSLGDSAYRRTALVAGAALRPVVTLKINKKISAKYATTVKLNRMLVILTKTVN